MGKIIGWQFPIVFNKYSQSVETSQGNQSIKESLRVLMTTTCGERIMELEYGSDINKIAFKNLDLNTITYITNDIKKIIERWEERISIKNVEIRKLSAEEGIICISLSYIVKETNEVDNFEMKYNLQNG